MLTCQKCKDEACPDAGGPGAGCDDFTSRAIEEEKAEWAPTREDYDALEHLYNDAMDSLGRKIERIRSYERAVAELVKWAQGDETL